MKPQKPLAQHWMSFTLGRSVFYMAAVINTRDKRLRVQLALKGPDAKRYFAMLFSEREKYEMLLGSALEWSEAPSSRESHIYIHRLDSDPADRRRWIEYFTWIAEQLENLNNVFRPIITLPDDVGA